MNTPSTFNTIVTTSWNGTPFVYNNERDTWEMSDNTSIGKEHKATGGDMEAAWASALREIKNFGEMELIEYNETL